LAIEFDGTVNETLQTVLQGPNGLFQNFINASCYANVGNYKPLDPTYVFLSDVTLPFLKFPYIDCLTAIQEVIKLYLASNFVTNNDYTGVHWIVLPSGQFALAPIGKHQAYCEWDTSTLPYTPLKPVSDIWADTISTPIVVGQNILSENLKTELPVATAILMSGIVETPPNDEWIQNITDYPNPESGWIPLTGGELNLQSSTLTVGYAGYSLTQANGGNFIHPCAVPFTQVITEDNSVEISFWCRTHNSPSPLEVILVGSYNGSTLNEWFSYDFSSQVPNNDMWFPVSIKIELSDITDRGTSKWKTWNNALWDTISFIGFIMGGSGSPMWIQGLSITYTCQRMGTDSTLINNPLGKSVDRNGYPLPPNGYGLRVVTIKDSISAVDYPFSSPFVTPTGKSTFAQTLVYELFRHSLAKTSGKVIVAGRPDILAGQMANITTDVNQAGKKFRITGLTHRFSKEGFSTELQITDDCYNSQPTSSTDPYTVLLRSINPDYQSRTLGTLKQSSGDFDPSTFPLVVDFPS
jgi:hypothetical protein